MNKYLIKLADHLDKKGLHKEADYVDWIMKKANPSLRLEDVVENEEVDCKSFEKKYSMFIKTVSDFNEEKSGGFFYEAIINMGLNLLKKYDGCPELTNTKRFAIIDGIQILSNVDPSETRESKYEEKGYSIIEHNGKNYAYKKMGGQNYGLSIGGASCYQIIDIEKDKKMRTSCDERVVSGYYYLYTEIEDKIRKLKR